MLFPEMDSLRIPAKSSTSQERLSHRPEASHRAAILILECELTRCPSTIMAF